MEDPNKILNTVKTIKSDFELLKKTENNIDNIKRSLGKKYPMISDNYPALFNLVFTPVNNWDDDLKNLSHMVGLASKVKSKKLTQHDASVKIGQTLVDKFVKPQLKKEA